MEKELTKLLSEFSVYTGTVDGLEFNLENFHKYLVEKYILNN